MASVSFILSRMLAATTRTGRDLPDCDLAAIFVCPCSVPRPKSDHDSAPLGKTVPYCTASAENAWANAAWGQTQIHRSISTGCGADGVWPTCVPSLYRVDRSAKRGYSATAKTEAWVVLEVGPQSCIYAGLKTGTTAAGLRLALKSGTVVDQLAEFTSEAPRRNFPAGWDGSRSGRRHRRV
jgi:hypothetical protein